MRVISPETEAAWKAPVHAGRDRPTVRATIEPGRIRQRPYNTRNSPGGDYDWHRHRKGLFRNIVFGSRSVRELYNIRSCSWSRSVEQDVSECTLTLLNADLIPIGDASNMDNDNPEFELPGHMTYSRGDDEDNPWGYDEETGWNGQFVPARLVRTYEGYGYDEGIAPGRDPNLHQSGTWLVDTVKYDSNGDIQLQMRDLGRLLLDFIVFKPIIPHDDYPLQWSKIAHTLVPRRDVAGGSWGRPPATFTSSNMKYVGKNIEERGGFKYVNGQGGVDGHYASHPYRDDEEHELFWMSTGQTSYNEHVWWEVDFKKKLAAVGAIRIRTKMGPYRIYISIHNGDRWLGRRDIPYEKDEDAVGGVNIGAKIPYVKSVIAERITPEDIVLPREFHNVKKIRLTFTRLRRPFQGVNYAWRAMLHNFKVYSSPSRRSMNFTRGTAMKAVGNYRDYTDIVKWSCAWAGFWWPDAPDNFIEYDAIEEEYAWLAPDPVLPAGRAWGSWQNTGTAGLADLTPDLFDKQPLMDVINYVREVTGFSFWIDETGGVVWRMPNLFKAGNYISPHHLEKHRKPTRTAEYVTIDENETLKTYSTTLSDRNLRERVFVANSNGKFGTVVKGFNPYRTGLMRVAGWTDQHWKNRRECKVAADMIVARQMFDYRRSTATIAGNPAIQVDDQIRILERTTNETYFHYVIGISSTLDMVEGTWDYNLDTHWLGDDPEATWAVKVDQLDKVTQSYLNTIGDVE